jgi:uncharacterized protein (TIGR02001 family)
MSSRSRHRRSTPAPRQCGARRLLLLTALLTSLPCVGTHAEPIDLSFGVASATVLRGIALGEGAVDAHAGASYAGPNGWRATLGATALHLKPSRQRWDGQLFWRLGYGHRLGDDWSVQLAHAHYAYPGSSLLRRYGHDELGATFAYRDLLYLSVAGLRRTHYRASGSRDSLAYDIVARCALPSALSASAGLGYLESRGSSFAYAYGHLGLGAQWGTTQAQVTYIATDSAAKQRFGDAAANRWTASLGWNF